MAPPHIQRDENGSAVIPLANGRFTMVDDEVWVFIMECLPDPAAPLFVHADGYSWVFGRPVHHLAADMALRGLLRKKSSVAASPTETVAVPEPDGAPLPLEDGVVARSAVVRQAREARAAVERHAPDAIATLGGDCGVSIAPFAYLSSKYGDDFGVLWVDAHPDILDPQHWKHAHTYPLRALLGEGDAEFVGLVDKPVAVAKVMYAGLDAWSPAEGEIIARLGLHRAGSADLAASSRPVLDWIAENKIGHLAVHLDLDVMDPASFRPLIFSRADATYLDGVPRGRMQPAQVARLLSDVASATQVVGLTIAEHMPWDAIAFRDMLAGMPLLGRG
ncbi:hypothetical protein DFJ74DRAFT_774392 [Hyaloraphidium curvatum]|nr:hypothetical protein DFJ74DRAFT_774392 [Hyaloraphidium curvatum]